MGKILIKNKGITLIALVITIIIIIILAGITIATLTGENGIITRSMNAKGDAILAEGREKIKLAAIDAYIGGAGTILYEDLIEALNKNFKGNGTGIDYYQIVEGDSSTSSWKVRAHTSAGDVDEIIGGNQAPQVSYQWKVVADNDNSGTISIGDEVAPLIDSIKNEHFIIINISGSLLELLTKLCVDTTSNSQSNSAPSVTFDKVFDTGDGGIQVAMSSSDVKYIYVEPSEEGMSGYWENTYYIEGEIGTLVSNGIAMENYENRFIQAGMTLQEIQRY